jgi:hypothetical protein
MDKSASYLTALYMHVLGLQDWSLYDSVVIWADGCGQMKNRQVFCTLVRYLLESGKASHLSFCFFAPKHGKGAADAYFGNLSRTLEHKYSEQAHSTIAEAVATLRSAAAATAAASPSSSPQCIEEYMPDDRSDYTFEKFTAASLMGIQFGYKWQFSLNDVRRSTPHGGRLTGKGLNCNVFTAVDCKYYGLCNQKVIAKQFPCLDASDSADPDVVAEAEEPLELNVETRVHRGWRVSFCKDETNEEPKLIAHMARFGAGLARLPSATEGHRDTSTAVLRASAKSSAARKRVLEQERTIYLRDMKKLVVE